MTNNGRSLRILTFNVGLLELTLGRFTIDEVPFRDERVPGIIDAIASSGADVVCLQEVFKPERFRVLADGLKAVYPFNARHDNSPWLGLGHGLAIFSSLPLTRSRFTPFRAGLRHEKLVIRRGFLLAELDAGNGGPLGIVNLHTTAGGRIGTESAVANRLRNVQLDEVDAAVKASPLACVVTGDFNAGPEASPENYVHLLQKGYQDAALSGARGRVIGPTWRPDNELVAGSGFEDSPPQRIDHVLLDERASAAFDVADSQLVFEDLRVPIGEREVTISDHAGLLVTLAPADR